MKNPHILFLCLATIACSLFAEASGATDVPVIRFRMDEIWRMEGSDQDDFLFGEVEDLVIDEDGTLFVLDSQLANVKVFSDAGEYLRTIGREGDGPGEVRAPGDLVFMPDGSLGLVSKLNWKITKIDKETGDARGEVRTLGDDGDVVLLHQARGLGRSGSGDSYVALVRESTGSHWHWRMYLGLYRDSGDEQGVYPEAILSEVGEARGADVEEEEFFSIWDPWTVDASGRIVVAPYWNRYVLQYFDDTGGLNRQVELPYSRRERTAAERNRLLDKVWGGTSPEEFGVELVSSETEAVVRRIHPRPDGRLWIRTCNSAHDVDAGVFRIYDVVDPNGNLEARAEIHGHADDLVDRVYFGSRGLMVVVHGAERYVQNHRGLNREAPEYDLAIAGYRLQTVPHER